jgi:hypothetical protein
MTDQFMRDILDARKRDAIVTVNLYEAYILNRDIVKELVTAWESLPAGEDYPVDLIQAWLDTHMKPVVDKAREIMKVQ